MTREKMWEEFETGIIDVIERWKKRLEQEPKEGHWKRIGYDIYECSICGQNVQTIDICAYKHCHGCGARIESEDE